MDNSCVFGKSTNENISYFELVDEEDYIYNVLML